MKPKDEIRMTENQIENYMYKQTTHHLIYKKSISNRTEKFAEIMWVDGKNPLEKLKIMNHLIKDSKYIWTKLRSDFYKLKRDIKKQFVKTKGYLKDKWRENTKVRINLGGIRVVWHFTKRQYNSLKKQWFIK